MSQINNKLYKNIKLLEEYNRSFWTINIVLLCLIILRLNRLHGAIQFLIIILVATLFVLINLLKTEKESLLHKSFRNTKTEICFFVFMSLALFFLMKNNYAVINFKNFNLFFSFITSLIFLFLAIKSKNDRTCHTSGMLHEKKVYIGSEKQGINNIPHFITDDDRLQHLSTFGVTGSGKSVSILYPLINHDIRTKKFTIILDPKGDVDFRDYVYSCCEKHKRNFKFISIGRSDISDGYNPFGFGDANAVKDKILSSTDWSEQFYKKIAGNDLQKALLAAFKSPIIQSNGLNNGFSLDSIIHFLPKNNERLEGLIAHLETMQFSSFSNVLKANQPTLYDYYTENAVLYFSLDSLTLKEMSRGMGRIFLQDLGSLGGYIFANIPKKMRKEIAVHVDEMATFYSEDFDSILSQIRGANVRLSLANQSIGDYLKHGEGVLPTVVDNTSIKIIMAANDPDSAEYLSRMIGTKEIIKTTKQVDEDLTKETGKGSSRDAHEFIVGPDQIKRFKTGEGVLMVKNEDKRVCIDFDSLFFDDVEIKNFETKSKKIAIVEDSEESITNKRDVSVVTKMGEIYDETEWNN